jgi:hypothetical protein
MAKFHARHSAQYRYEHYDPRLPGTEALNALPVVGVEPGGRPDEDRPGEDRPGE